MTGKGRRGRSLHQETEEAEASFFLRDAPVCMTVLVLFSFFRTRHPDTRFSEMFLFLEQ